MQVEKNNVTNLQNFLYGQSKWNVINPVDQIFLPSHEQLIREYAFSSDKNTYEFAYAVLVLAEEYNHHPTLVTEWHKVTLAWSTHSQKSITDLDIEMAKRSDDIFLKIEKGERK